MRRLAPFAVLVALAVALAACSPRTVGAPADGRHLQARFDTVQNLVVGHDVRVADVKVGTVTGIELDGYEAVVHLQVERDVPVVGGTRAAIRQTSLLGEDFVALALPDGEVTELPVLADGSELPTGPGPPDLESVVERALRLLAAVATDDVDTLVDTSVAMLDGREGQVRDLLREVADVTHQYAERRDQLGAAIDGLDEVGGQLAAGSDDVATLVDDVDRATTVLARQRERLVEGMTVVSRLAEAAEGSVLGDTRDELEATLDELAPVISELAADTERLDVLISRVLAFVDRIREVVREDEIELYGLMTSGDGPLQRPSVLQGLREAHR